MGGLKRKEAPNGTAKDVKKQKTVESKKSKLDLAAAEDEDFGGFSGDDEDAGGAALDGKPNAKTTASFDKSKSTNGQDAKKFKLETSSAEAHAKQRQLAKERKAAKPNADLIHRSKKIWERLRRKSHVPLSERKELVSELFAIITGRVQDFVFKHDSVRVIQCALKYSNNEQRRIIVDELKGDIRTLVESKYGKFLVAKMVVEGNQEVRDIVVPEFYGHVKRLINHPEAGWLVDDVYRQVATPKQKAVMLTEWYGTEFALAHRNAGSPKAAESGEETADLKKIIEKQPEKRKVMLDFLRQLINSLVQKGSVSFTMLHDAMLQYFLALPPGADEHTEFLELLKSDIETKAEVKESTDSSGGGHLLRNLAFTKSGHRLVCLSLAYGSAKDRKVILRCFKDTVELMAFDPYAKMVLITGLDVPDDTKMSGKAILHEILGQGIEDETQKLQRLEGIVTNLVSRVPVLYPLAGPAKWLMNDQDKALLEEVHGIRKTTSKKAPEVRRKEVLEYLSPPLLELVSKSVPDLAQSSFGCQAITETLLEADSSLQNADAKAHAKTAVANLAAGDPNEEGHIAQNPAAGRMLKTLVLGGNFDPETKKIKLAEPNLSFTEALFPVVKDKLVQWACSPSSFVVVALLESEDVPPEVKKDVRKALEKGGKKIEKAAKGDDAVKAEVNDGKEGGRAKKRKIEGGKGNAGARILLEKLGA